MNKLPWEIEREQRYEIEDMVKKKLCDPKDKEFWKIVWLACVNTFGHLCTTHTRRHPDYTKRNFYIVRKHSLGLTQKECSQLPTVQLSRQRTRDILYSIVRNLTRAYELKENWYGVKDYLEERIKHAKEGQFVKNEFKVGHKFYWYILGAKFKCPATVLYTYDEHVVFKYQGRSKKPCCKMLTQDNMKRKIASDAMSYGIRKTLIK